MKKMISKIVPLFLSVIMMLSLSLPSFASEGEKNALKFNENGNFRIMIIADPQDVVNPRQETLDLMNAALDSAKPDLVVFTGDNIEGPSYHLGKNQEKVKKAIEQITEPVTSRNIPFCTVFGNHDNEGGVSKEFQMQVYQSLPNCLAVGGDKMTGYGNYNITLKAHGSDKDIFNLWFVDSGTYNNDKNINSYYAFVADDQIEWYKNKSNELKEKNGGEPLPSMLFQHMPVPEIFDLLKEVPKGTENAVSKNGKYYVLNEELATGQLGEGPCPPDYNNGQFSAWKEQGDIVAAFFGHDHVNDFVGTLDGIDLIHTPGAGFYSYGNGLNHGVRIIDINENDLSYTTETLYYGDLVGDSVYGKDYLLYEGKGTRERKILTALGITAGAVGVCSVAAAVAALIIKKKKI